MSENKSTLNISNFEDLIKYINSNYILTDDEYNALLHMLSTYKYLDERCIYIGIRDFAPYNINKKQKIKFEKLANEIVDNIREYNETKGQLIKLKFDEKMKYKNTLYYNKSESYVVSGSVYFRDDDNDIWEIPVCHNSYQHIEKSRMDENRYADFYIKVAKSLSVYKNHLKTTKKYLFEGYRDGLITDDDFYVVNIKVCKDNKAEYIIHSVQCKDGIIYKQDLKYDYTIEVPQEIIVSWRRIAKYD